MKSGTVSSGVVTFDQVWKKFVRGERHTSLRDLIPAAVRSMVRPRSPESLKKTEFWALRDVSFSVRSGEALGIIGPNGAGKSTTLKLLTRIMRPSRGRCGITGRVGALIEIAAGFHGDLTGRENVFLQGAIMGMKRVDIARKMDAIIDFSGLEAFIETPVKRYSSGMNARLGFSIAANLEPDVLVIDEVLAVGDLSFQTKCIDRMQEFRRRGVAIVFVSHNLQAVSALCQRAIFLAGGVKADGRTDAVIQAYVASSHEDAGVKEADLVRVQSVALSGPAGPILNDAVRPGDFLTLEASYLPRVSVQDVTFEFQVYRSTDNLFVHGSQFTGADLGVALEEGREIRIGFRFTANLTSGHYHVLTRVWDNLKQAFLNDFSPPAVFAVEDKRTWAGVAHLGVVAELRRDLHGAVVSDASLD